MTVLPSNLVDFGTALQMLADSQKDVTELVTKLDQLVNTSSPMTVDINLTSGTVTVDNIALIKNNLMAAATNTAPIVQNMTVITTDGKQKTYVSPKDISGRMLLVPNGSFNDKDNGSAGYSVGIRNTMRTCVIAEETEANVSLPELPEVLLAGARWLDGETPHTTLKINIQPFQADSKKYVSDRHYYTKMSVVNVSESTFTVTIADKFGTPGKVDTIPAHGTIEYLLFSLPNQNASNVVVVNRFGG